MLRSWKAYALGLPLVVASALGALFVWGQLQPRPDGHAPSVAGATDTVAQPAAPVQYTIDASDGERWVYFDFTQGSVVEAAFDAPGWDLAFRRTRLLTNSGVTNPAGPAGVIDLGETTIEQAFAPAAAEFAVDEVVADDDDKNENPAIRKWYRYNYVRHVIVARENVYVVRTGGEQDAIVQFDSYYCEDGSPGCVTFTYRLVPRAGD